jgi:hypothetical protein
MTGEDLDREARATLQDKDAVIWAPEDMLDWINAFQREVLTHKPKACTGTQNLTLTANVTKQTVPAGVLQVLDILTNMGTDGATPGRAISRTTMDRLQAARPTWRGDTGAAVKHWIEDDRDASVFYVWPAPTLALKVEARTIDIPAELTDLATALTVDDSYRNAGVHYVLFRAYSQNGQDSFHANLAASHYGVFASILGIQVKQQKKASAGANSTVNPAHPVVDKNGA